MADYKTLLLTGAKALKLDDELAMLQAVADTFENWGKLKVHLTDFASVEELLTRLAKDLGSDPIKQAFKAVGLEETHARLLAFLGKVTNELGDIDPRIKALLSPLGSFAAGADGKVAWTIATSDGPVVKTDQYALTLGANLAIAFDAGAEAPGVPGSTRFLKLGAAGGLKANANGTLPYAYGNVQAGADGAIQAALDYYFRAPSDTIYVAAVAGRLGRLPDPFDFDSVWDAFGATDLEAIAYEFGGTANLSLQVMFADAQALGGGLVGDLGLTVGVKASLKSSYKLTLRRAGAASALAVNAVLSRKRVDEATFNNALGLEVDIGALTKPVLEAFKGAVDQWDATLADIKDYLSPGTWLREHLVGELKPKLEALIGDATLRDAALTDLNGALGLANVSSSALADWLVGQIGGAVDSASVLVDTQAGKAIDRVMARLNAALPALATLARTDPTADLKTLVSGAIDKIKAALKTQVDGLFAGDRAALTTAIEKAGVAVNGAVATADDALKAVRDLLTRYDKVLHDILNAAEEAAKKKVTARLYGEESRLDETVVEAAGLFTAHSPAASRVFEAFTRGSLQGLVRLIDGADVAPGFTLDAAHSSISRYSKLQSTKGFELVFLNITLKAEALLTAEARVVVDGEGNVQVRTRGELKKTLSFMADTREASFVGAYGLVLAAAVKKTPSAGKPVLNLAIGARYDDASLDWSDVDEFIQGLAEAGLVAEGVEERLKAVFNAWGGGVSGDVSASLILEGAAIETLLQLPHRGGGKLDDAARKTIYLAGFNALANRKAFRRPWFVSGAAVAAANFADHSAPTQLDDILLRYRQQLRSGGADPKRPDDDAMPTPQNTPLVDFHSASNQQFYAYFLRQAFALDRLVDLIDVMGAIYQAPPAGVGVVAGTWDKEAYLKAQLKMTRASGYWLTVADDLGSLWESEVSRRTTAFMRVMADLAGVAGGVRLTITRRPAAGTPETVSFD